jgi:hypothetical protein
MAMLTSSSPSSLTPVSCHFPFSDCSISDHSSHVNSSSLPSSFDDFLSLTDRLLASLAAINRSLPQLTTSSSSLSFVVLPFVDCFSSVYHYPLYPHQPLAPLLSRIRSDHFPSEYSSHLSFALYSPSSTALFPLPTSILSGPAADLIHLSHEYSLTSEPLLHVYNSPSIPLYHELTHHSLTSFSASIYLTPCFILPISIEFPLSSFSSFLVFVPCQPMDKIKQIEIRMNKIIKTKFGWKSEALIKYKTMPESENKSPACLSDCTALSLKLWDKTQQSCLTALLTPFPADSNTFPVVLVGLTGHRQFYCVSPDLLVNDLKYLVFHSWNSPGAIPYKQFSPQLVKLIVQSIPMDGEKRIKDYKSIRSASVIHVIFTVSSGFYWESNSNSTSSINSFSLTCNGNQIRATDEEALKAISDLVFFCKSTPNLRILRNFQLNARVNWLLDAERILSRLRHLLSVKRINGKARNGRNWIDNLNENKIEIDLCEENKQVKKGQKEKRKKNENLQAIPGVYEELIQEYEEEQQKKTEEKKKRRMEFVDLTEEEKQESNIILIS